MCVACVSMYGRQRRTTGLQQASSSPSIHTQTLLASGCVLLDLLSKIPITHHHVWKYISEYQQAT